MCSTFSSLSFCKLGFCSVVLCVRVVTGLWLKMYLLLLMAFMPADYTQYHPRSMRPTCFCVSRLNTRGREWGACEENKCINCAAKALSRTMRKQLIFSLRQLLPFTRAFRMYLFVSDGCTMPTPGSSDIWGWNGPKHVLDRIYVSCYLPYANSILQASKWADTSFWDRVVKSS